MFQNSFLCISRLHQEDPKLFPPFLEPPTHSLLGTMWRYHFLLPMVPTIWLQHILKVKGKIQARWHKPAITAFGNLTQNHLQFQADLGYNWKTTSKKRN